VENITLPPQLQQYSGKLFESFASIPLPGGLIFAPSYLQAIAMVFLIFLLVLTLGQLRRKMVDWHFKGLIPGVAFGFLIALFLEGIMIVGGKTILTEIVGWKNAPKPIVAVLDAGRNKMVSVLGITDEIPQSLANEPVSPDSVFSQFKSLSPEDQSSLKAIMCSP
jgi:hypothetical protein